MGPGELGRLEIEGTPRAEGDVIYNTSRLMPFWYPNLYRMQKAQYRGFDQ